MKKRTIEKVLQTKFFDFVSSIKDENVKELVTKNSFISGGCIVSMLLKEKVHDYDIYFTNKETVLAVSKYYASLFKKAKAEVVDVDSILHVLIIVGMIIGVIATYFLLIVLIKDILKKL